MPPHHEQVVMRKFCFYQDHSFQVLPIALDVSSVDSLLRNAWADCLLLTALLSDFKVAVVLLLSVTPLFVLC